MNSQSNTSCWQNFWSLAVMAQAMEVAALMLEILIAFSVLATPVAIFLWFLQI